MVANYDGGSISVIDVSLDEYGNDSATFGTTYTIPVGNTATPNPASVTVLADGSKAYTANQNDGAENGTVTVVNLSTHTVEKTLTVVGHPRTVRVDAKLRVRQGLRGFARQPIRHHHPIQPRR